MRIFTAVLLVMVAMNFAYAQQMPRRQLPDRQIPVRTEDRLASDTATLSQVPKLPQNVVPLQTPERGKIEPMTSFEFWLSIIILVFTLAIMATEVGLIVSGKLSMTAESAIRVVLVTLIIGGTLFLIASGYSNDQIAPAMGLFGTIAGYLLGKSAAKDGTGNQ